MIDMKNVIRQVIERFKAISFLKYEGYSLNKILLYYEL